MRIIFSSFIDMIQWDPVKRHTLNKKAHLICRKLPLEHKTNKINPIYARMFTMQPLLIGDRVCVSYGEKISLAAKRPF